MQQTPYRRRHAVCEMQYREPYSDFGPESDPSGEHDFGAVLVPEALPGKVNAAFSGPLRRVFWKIDYYAPGLTQGSEDHSPGGKRESLVSELTQRRREVPSIGPKAASYIKLL